MNATVKKQTTPIIATVANDNILLQKQNLAKKYELTSETREFNGRILHRIRAIKDFIRFLGSDDGFCIKAGTLGGFIENESNLDHRYGCWVSDDAMVYGGARVAMDALVYGNAVIYEQARVGGSAHIYDNAHIYGSSKVKGSTHVYGNAEVGFSHNEDNPEIYGNARVYEKARIEGNSRFFGNAQVYGRALIEGNAKVCDNAQACGSLHLLRDAVLSGDKKLTRGFRDYIKPNKVKSRVSKAA